MRSSKSEMVLAIQQLLVFWIAIISSMRLDSQTNNFLSIS